MAGSTKLELCKATGYTRTDKNGQTKVCYSELMAATLEAKGINLPTDPSGTGGGPRPSFQTTALEGGNIVVGKCYTKLLEVVKGDKFDIVVDEDALTITLKLVVEDDN